MKLTINGTPREWAGGSLADIWQAETREMEVANPRGFAIALNGAVVRRTAWAETTPCDGDQIEIVRAMAGG